MKMCYIGQCYSKSAVDWQELISTIDPKILAEGKKGEAVRVVESSGYYSFKTE